MTDEKTCRRCGQLKSKECFVKDKSKEDGFDSRCKECARFLASYRRANGHGLLKEKPRKACAACGEIKSLDDFKRNPRRPDGKSERCKSCAKLESQERLVRKEAALARVRSICRTPGDCRSKSSTRPCHGCSLAHKAKTDSEYYSKILAAGEKGREVVDSDPIKSHARFTRFIDMFKDEAFLEGHAARNREKLDAIRSDPEKVELMRQRTIERNSSEEVASVSRERLESPEFKEKRMAGYNAWLENRRVDEEFEHFMERMEREEKENEEC